MIDSAKLAAKLEKDFPDFQFKYDNRAMWSPSEKTVHFTDDVPTLLHELGHAILKHLDFQQDIELIHMERDAWEKARELANKYRLSITDNQIENSLDNYRDWLHQRSLCPECNQTGIQSAKNLSYYCINCGSHWTANDARSCGLKRRLIQKQKTVL